MIFKLLFRKLILSSDCRVEVMSKDHKSVQK